MGVKKKKSTLSSGIKVLAAKFDQSLFTSLVAETESKLVEEYPEGGAISKRLFDLKQKYRDRDTALNILAQEKIHFRILKKREPDTDEESLKAEARRIVAIANSHRLPHVHTQHQTQVSRNTPIGNTDWRSWGCR